MLLVSNLGRVGATEPYIGILTTPGGAERSRLSFDRN